MNRMLYCARAASLLSLFAFAGMASADASARDHATLRPAPIESFLPRPARERALLSPFERWRETSDPGAAPDVSIPDLQDPLRLRVPLDPRAASAGEWSAVPPPQLWGHAMIYDPVRDWMVMSGGALAFRPQNQVWILRGEGLGGWERLDASGTPPAPGPASIVFDSGRERMLCLANAGPGGVLAVRALSLRGRPQWSELLAARAPGAGFAVAASVYDPDADQVIALSGGGPIGVQILALGEPAAWGSIAVTPVGPEGRPVAVGWDRARHRLLAAVQPSTGAGQLWELRMGFPATWTRIDAPDGPYLLTGGVLDERGDRLLLVDDAEQLWAFPITGPAAWSRLGAPTKSRLHGFALALDTRRRRLLLHGGFDFTSSSSRTRTFPLVDDGLWSDVANPPGATRIWHSAIFDSRQDQMVVFGGWIFNPYLPADSLSALSMRKDAIWSGVSATGPAPRPRFGHAVIRDPVNDRMVVFGGQSTDGTGDYLADVWALPLKGAAEWRQLLPGTASGPGVRRFAAATYDSRRQRMLCFSGDDGVAFLHDAWQLDLDGTPAWSPLAMGGEVPDAAYLSAFYDRTNDRVILCSNEGRVWSLPLTGAPRVQRLEPGGEGPPPYATPLVHDTRRNRLVWFRALSPQGNFRYEEYWTLSLDGPVRWTHVASRGLAPPSRYLMSMVYDEARDRALLYGGYEDEADYFGDTWMLSWSGETRDSLLALKPTHRRGFDLRGVVSRSGSLLEAEVLLPEGEEASVEVFDVQGRRLMSQRIEAGAPGVRSVRIEPPAPLSAGVYLVRVAQGRESRTARAVVLR